ncbi:LysR family transcriptional regulator [Rhodophyticola sp. CCM32]|uniref:LysR family transcriptional regulator n=1 Tax=Rhodophyticola sp. CCM32 TaxID=2916397 RepID=UPI00107F5068|nr:LysR family transcriptional regulator [Rhodophyticola sp. CCM32]QBY00827.1 LysR family transcriptional regulator [Rhodophyticola sp. CCM32]
MESQPHWDDYAYFAAVARTGGIARAAQTSGVSTATLSRRMRAFEARLGRRLFLHGASGYTLTAEGRTLWDKIQRMETAAADISQWRQTSTGPVPVRISAGTWTALHISERLDEIWRPDAPWLPEFIHCELPMDIARREIDIGIRNRRPEQPWLAGQRVGTTEFAIYATDKAITGWIGPADDAAATRSAQWVEAHHGAQIVTRSNLPLFAYQMARAGVGRVVLPLPVGDGAPGLIRLSDPIPELCMERWLVSHHEGRHEPPVRAALTALARFFTSTPATLEQPAPVA